ncbi:MAG: aldo/keto reductase, partial [Gluconacetobacter liquefaciens]
GARRMLAPGGPGAARLGGWSAYGGWGGRCAREGVTAPIASATKRSHVESFAKAAALVLEERDIVELDQASAP